MSLPFLSAEHIEAFILVLLRVSSIVVTIPVMSDKSVPARFKAALALIITLIIFPVVLPKISPTENFGALIFMLRMIGEVMIGLIIGFVARLIFICIQIAGDIIGFQMGLSIVNVIDPMTSAHVSIIAELFNLIAMLVFLTVNAHHFFFSAIVQSYSIVNPMTFDFSGQLMQFIFDFTKEAFVIALKIGAPIIAVMLFTSVGLGLVARTVPQINVFIIGLPLQVAIGLIFLGITAPMFVKMAQWIFSKYETSIIAALRLM